MVDTRKERRPLRKVTYRDYYGAAQYGGSRQMADRLECGHIEPVRGNTRYTDALRRRCSQCPTLEKKS